MIERLDYRGKLTDRNALGRLLADAGLGAGAAGPKADLFAKAAERVLAEGNGVREAEITAFFLPGRIEVLGKHTDYPGGASMLVAAQRGFCLVVAPRSDCLVRVSDVARDEMVQFDLDPELEPRAGHWSNYPMTVARRVARNFPEARRGVEIAFGSDLPPAAGMSSSSAMIVAMFLALAEVNGLWDRGEFSQNVTNLTDLAAYLAVVENGQTFGTLAGDLGVGTAGGSEDHTAILCCRPNRLDEYSYCPIRFQRSVPLPQGYTFAVGASGVVAEKTGEAMEKYNRASRLARVAAELWRRETGGDEAHLGAVLASSPEAADRLARIIETAEMPDQGVDRRSVKERFEHFLTENQELRPAAGDALARGDMDEFGRYTEESQAWAEQMLGNQIPETSYLAAIARKIGAAASLAFGAGFGGSVWALVQTSGIDEFLEGWAWSYRKRFPQHAQASQFFATGAGPATFQIGGIDVRQTG
jgi:galactokinase